MRIPPAPIRSHHASHGNYPSERSGSIVARVLPPGRCELCRTAPNPCGWCVANASRCTGCGLQRCNGSNVFCRNED